MRRRRPRSVGKRYHEIRYQRQCYQNSNQNQSCTQKSGNQNARTCPSAAEYIGNVFLLGLATLAGEVIDLQAANALELLLGPFLNEGEENAEQQEILANAVQEADIVDLLEEINE